MKEKKKEEKEEPETGSVFTLGATVEVEFHREGCVSSYLVYDIDGKQVMLKPGMRVTLKRADYEELAGKFPLAFRPYIAPPETKAVKGDYDNKAFRPGRNASDKGL